ncbi:MAG: type III pantothenate kinase [Rubrivivax sp.]|nr:type III pantothenate kinase [Rubrivivax sp.]
MSFLAIDCGNTRLKWALYDAARPDAVLLRQGAVFLETIDELGEGGWNDLPEPDQMLGSIVAGDQVRRRVEEQMERWEVQPRWVVPTAAEAGLVNGYDHPHRLGADRWVALAGARRRALAAGAGGGAHAGQGARAALVVMVGTAVTVDALDASGHFLGGLILPGFGLMLKSLESGTAGLRVPTGEVVDFPTNTSDALMSGGANAIAGAIERQYRRLEQRAGHPPLLLLAGGAAVKVGPTLELPFEMVDTLVFEGLLHLQAQRSAARG